MADLCFQIRRADQDLISLSRDRHVAAQFHYIRYVEANVISTELDK